MVSRFMAVVAALALVVSSANAEIYTMFTAGTPTKPNSMVTPSTSGLGLNVNLAGLVNAVIPLTALVPGSFVEVDMNLDASDSGTLHFVGGQLTLVNFNYVIPLGFLGSVTATGTGVGFNVVGGPITVTNGNYSITAANTGALNINAGTIGLVGTVLGQNVNAALNFNTSPVSQPFSALGLIVIPGTVDDGAIGSDADNDAHNDNKPGLTGVSTIDTDGAEIFINYGGLAIATTITSGTLVLPSTITITGSATASVPEVGSMALIGFALVGGLLVARRRLNG
jgi:hypothetical protein